jgi:hypothetical protein
VIETHEHKGELQRDSQMHLALSRVMQLPYFTSKRDFTMVNRPKAPGESIAQRRAPKRIKKALYLLSIGQAKNGRQVKTPVSLVFFIVAVGGCFVCGGTRTAPHRKTHRARPFSTVASNSGFPVNRHHVSNSGPMLSSSPARATKSPRRLRRSAAINSGTRPDTNVFRPMSRSMSAFTGMCEYHNSSLNHHHNEDGRRCANHASTPHLRPARPTASPRDASTGTSSSHIHPVPHSEIQRLPRNRKATNATGRVSRPTMSRIPRDISVMACKGAAIAAWLAIRPMTAFHAAGE